jgi:malate dehydrogenase (oxaloacetate-decarboxylating)
VVTSHLSPGYSITVRLEIENRVGQAGRITSAIGRAGGDIGAIDIVGFRKGIIVRDITVNARDEAHAADIVAHIGRVHGVQVRRVSDRTFLMHLGGKVEVRSRVPLKTRDDLSMVYTPGVARVCEAIHARPEESWRLTMKGNSVAVVSDGSAVLGLGDIGPEAALPVMEGKAILFKQFAQVNAFPLCLATRKVDSIVAVVEAIAPNFGGINLEDISAPRCFEVEERLRRSLDIPVFHDDQHGTAVVVWAALVNALKIVGKPKGSLRVVISGAGAAGSAIARTLLAAGVANLIVCDRAGSIYRGRRTHMSEVKRWLAHETNPEGFRGTAGAALQGADVFIGVSAPGAVKAAEVRRMAPEAIVFALANPLPEVSPEEIAGFARIVATGRSDYANQINNVLCFPGLFRGVLDCRGRAINKEMELAAAEAIAGCVGEEELGEDYIIPSVFNKRVAERVAREVAAAAVRTGVARRVKVSETGL